MKTDRFQVLEPYSFKIKQDALFGPNTYTIEFEGVSVREFTASLATVVDFIALLNVAYSLGYNTGNMVSQLQ